MSTQRARSNARRIPAVVPSNDDPNPRAVVGANLPPEPLSKEEPVEPVTVTAPAAEPPPAERPLSEFEQVAKLVNDLYDEAKQAADGADIQSQGEADYWGNLLGELRAAHLKAETLRKAQRKPYDDAVAEIQKRFKPLTSETPNDPGKTIRAANVAKAILAPWLKKLADDKAREQELAAAEAERARQAAEDAIRETSGTKNLAAREDAEDLVREAKKAETAVRRVARSSIAAGGQTGKRSVSLRTVCIASAITNRFDAAKHFFLSDQATMDAFILKLAQGEVHRGAREIPGIVITESQQAV